MTELLDLRNLLQETTSTLERLERDIIKDPRDWSLAITAQSLRQRQIDLEREFASLANINLLDVCDYRLVPPESGEYPIVSVAKTLASFQELVTTVFDAFKTAPKLRARFTADIVAASTLNFGYAYPGSLGFVLTMPNDRLLLGESELDRAFEAIFEMAKAQRPAELAAYVARVGVASIRKLYSWSRAHAEAGLSADIHWRRQQADRAHVFVQRQELAHLTEIINQAIVETADPFDTVAELIGLDVGKSNSFRLRVAEAEDITGDLADGFDRTKTYQIPGWYRAHLLKKTKIHYSIEKEDEDWELLSLAPT
jgi:hypothetical protein